MERKGEEGRMETAFREKEEGWVRGRVGGRDREQGRGREVHKKRRMKTERLID